MIPETEPDQMSGWKEEMFLCVFAGNSSGSIPERSIRFIWTGMYITELYVHIYVHNRVGIAGHW